jgi:hypothetical protein
MVEWGESGLSHRQMAFAKRMLPGASIERDLSWGQFDNLVLQVRSGDRLFD